MSGAKTLFQVIGVWSAILWLIAVSVGDTLATVLFGLLAGVSIPLARFIEWRHP